MCVNFDFFKKKIQPSSLRVYKVNVKEKPAFWKIK